MLYGATNSPLASIVSEIKILSKLGFDYLELCLDPPQAGPDKVRENLSEIRGAADGEGLPPLVAHLPTFVWLADINESIRLASLGEVEAALDICALLGIRKAVLHPGYATGLVKFTPGLGRDLALQSLEAVLVQARQRKVTICLENMFPRAGHMYRPEEFSELFDMFPDLKMTVDLGHAWIRAPRDRMKRLIETAGSRLGHLHVSDNSGQDDEHLPVGVGRVDVGGGLEAVRKTGYSESMTLEVFSPDRDYLKISLEKVKTMWESSRN